MPKDTETFTPLSLAQHFEPPEEYTGVFGWVCGYSADSQFMENAAGRFTRQTPGQRAFVGRIALALMLDPGNPQITPIDVPGVLHLPIKADAKPFCLLHAKVAILGFRHSAKPRPWHVRLLV